MDKLVAHAERGKSANQVDLTVGAKMLEAIQLNR
jgi:hypothetical protein